MSYGRNCYVGQCDLIRPPALKIGQHDPVKVHLRSLEVGLAYPPPAAPKGVPNMQYPIINII